MIDVNRPAAVTAAFERYELALRKKYLAVLDKLFWDDQPVVRFDSHERLYDNEAVKRFRSARETGDLSRTLLRTTITSFGESAVTASVDFPRDPSGPAGHQMQAWIRTAPGWRAVAAHVTLDGSAIKPAAGYSSASRRTQEDPSLAPRGAA